jgi:hypothetical protein
MNWTFAWLKPGKGISYAQYADLVTEVFTAGVAALAGKRAARGAAAPAAAV